MTACAAYAGITTLTKGKESLGGRALESSGGLPQFCLGLASRGNTFADFPSVAERDKALQMWGLYRVQAPAPSLTFPGSRFRTIAGGGLVPREPPWGT